MERIAIHQAASTENINKDRKISLKLILTAAVGRHQHHMKQKTTLH